MRHRNRHATPSTNRIITATSVLILIIISFGMLVVSYISYQTKNQPKNSLPQIVESGSSAVLIGNPTKDANTSTFGLVCATVEKCDSKGYCSTYPSANSNLKRVKLSGLQQLSSRIYNQTTGTGEKAYIIECFNTGETYSCTTGNVQQDTQLFGKSNVPKDYRMNIMQPGSTAKLNNPVVLSTFSELEVESPANKNQVSTFMVAFEKKVAEPIVTQTGYASKGANECSLVQDPYGRVFDSYTLEPLSNAVVSLSQKRDNGLFTLVTTPAGSSSAITNPQVTSYDGMFSFMVPAGTYKLNADKDGYGGAVLKDLNPAYPFMYEDIYMGEEIEQKGAISHRDIPLTPLDLQASKDFADNNPVTIMNYFQSVDTLTGIYKIQGRVSHPRASIVVAAYIPNTRVPDTLVKTRTLAKKEADEYGRFVIEVDISSLKRNEIIGEIQAVKRPVLYANAEAGENASTGIRLDVPLAGISGLSQDITPGSVIQLRVPFSTKPVFETQVSNDGTFAIPPHYIPETAYSITVISPDGEQVALSTSQFYARHYAENSPTTLAKGQTDVLGVSDTVNTLYTWRGVILAVASIVGVIVLLSVILSYVALKKTNSSQ